MRAVSCSDGAVEVVEAPEPSTAGITVHVRAAGICGSDLHLVEGRFVDGTVLGHEIAGVTDDGTFVAVEPVISCGTCGFCEAGDNGLCSQAAASTIGIGLDGGMAERVRVPAHLIVPLPPGVDVADASLVEPLAVAVRALARVDVGPSTRVAVVGGGAIGLCAVAVARHLGAEVELIARHDHQRSAGERLGASAPTDQPADVVVEAAGTASALAAAVSRCRPGGKVAIPGTYWEPVELPGLEMGMKEISLVPSIMYGRTSGPRDVEVGAEILAHDPEVARTLITHRFPLDGAVDAFAVAADRAAGSIKVVLEPPG